MRRLASLLSLLAATALLSCDNVGSASGNGDARPQVAPPKLSPIELLPPKVDRSVITRVPVRNPSALALTQTDTFTQANGTVDILWVVDDSGSMANERTRLGANFERFITELTNAKSDYQIGVTTTNVNDRGQLRSGPKYQTRIITKPGPGYTGPTPGDIFRENTTFSASRAREEEGLRMGQLAVSPPNTNPGQPNEGFLRPNAALAVIIISNEDDHSYGDPNYYVRFFKGAKGRGNENLVTVSSIAGETPNGCYPPGDEQFYGGLADPGFRYDAVATKTSGVVGDICSTSFEDTLVQIVSALNTLRRVFPLSLKPDPATITVTVDGNLVPQNIVNGWQYDAATNSITFKGNYVPPPLSNIRFDYAVET